MLRVPSRTTRVNSAPPGRVSGLSGDRHEERRAARRAAPAILAGAKDQPAGPATKSCGAPPAALLPAGGQPRRGPCRPSTATTCRIAKLVVLRLRQRREGLGDHDRGNAARRVSRQPGWSARSLPLTGMQMFLQTPMNSLASSRVSRPGSACRIVSGSATGASYPIAVTPPSSSSDRRREGEPGRCDVPAAGRAELRRNAAFARVAPIGRPARLQLDVDCGADDAFGIGRRRHDPDLRALALQPAGGRRAGRRSAAARSARSAKGRQRAASGARRERSGRSCSWIRNLSATAATLPVCEGDRGIISP